MTWQERLQEVIQKVLQNQSSARIAVHSEDQAEWGSELLDDLANVPEDRVKIITLEIIPEELQDLFPVGTILPPY